MAKIILFDGGDGGGLVLTDNGVEPIPPFAPRVRSQIKAVGHLVATAVEQGPEHSELSGLATRLANIAIQQVEAIVGPLDPEASLIVTGHDTDGFVCGTTGKPPVPLPRPPRELPALTDMLERGVIDRSLLTFVQKATAQGKDVEEILEYPDRIAAELGIELSERSARDLKSIAPSQVEALDDPVSREVATFFQHVLADGRYVDTWAIRPAAVSGSLGVSLSPEATERIITVGAAFQRENASNRIIWIVVGIIVIVGVVVLEREAEVVDRSGIPKL
ncbi:hypothetical protein [Rhizohabitans arisaemae]|uniref:hypothetical protein n=1 Tax=Rhizohabitans arisaemae TaxID=2720610 RepID=UPI0024B0DC4C|nr:hypothetical protein [Rhizohabitans arisaemae]